MGIEKQLLEDFRLFVGRLLWKIVSSKSEVITVKKEYGDRGVVMKYLFMDEKGPQNSFKISRPFNKTDKLSYANDNMHSYVANVVQIDEFDYKNIEQKYQEIVAAYLSNRPQLRESLAKKGKELKGLDLLKSNFEYGIASMRKNELKFYTGLLDLLLEYNVENLLFLVSKMSIITSSRLINFLYFLDSETVFSAFIFKYIVTKYAEVEASEEVVKALLDKSLSTKKILELIRNDMITISRKNVENARMSRQIYIYNQVIEVIDLVLNYRTEFTEPNLDLSFDWSKVKWAFDLWLTEQRNTGAKNQYRLFLDEGIPQDTFNNIDLYQVDGECNSGDYIGLQITDMIVVLIGKLVSQLNSNSKYDFEKPDQRVLLCGEYYNFSEEQFNLIKKVQQFILARKGKYHFINDAYFDDSVLLETYIGYISSYDTFENFNKVEFKRHSELHMADFIKMSDIKFKEGIKTEILAKRMFGSIKAAVEAEMFRPL